LGASKANGLNRIAKLATVTYVFRGRQMLIVDEIDLIAKPNEQKFIRVVVCKEIYF
jgi:hypothetical protein